ncbi:MAG TPA: FtsQ-type POTRA domain-containing protein [Thermoanaerobaculia bacterium]
MSTHFDTTSPRFLRPTDVARLRRNQRRIQVQRLLVILRNAGVAGIVVIAAIWAWRHTQSDERFAVRTIEIEGAVHSSRAEVDAITKRYVGLNLFKMDIARVQQDMGGLAWVRRIEIEKKLPDVLRIKITERNPVALVLNGERIHYVDERGVAFAELAPEVGDDDLPIITGATGAELARSVNFLRELKQKDAEVYSRISEVSPIPPHGFLLFDRQLAAFVYANADDVSPKWRNLYALAAAEKLEKGDIEYADLRFADRIVLKPVKHLGTGATRNANGLGMPAGAPQITN